MKPDTRPKLGDYTPLMAAAYFGSDEVIDFLLEKGLSTEAHSSLNFPPIIIAIQRGHENAAATLIDASSNLDYHTWGKTALLCAVGWHKRKIARQLLECGADPDMIAPGSTSARALVVCKD